MPTKDEIRDFSNTIREMADAQKIHCMDAIVQYCEKNAVEVEIAATLISSHLKARIKEEAQSVNLIKRAAKLPL